MLVYCVPMFCGFLIAIVYHECGLKTSLATYVTVSILSYLLSVNIECSFMFAFLFGYYPILREYINKLKRRNYQWLLKILVFNISVILAYILLIDLLGILDFEEFSGDLGIWGAFIFLILGNVVFFIYDRALLVLTYKYLKIWRKKIFKR